jgi:TM2 domain-containing membrane protein YozV
MVDEHISRNEGLSAVLSFVIPGAGQIYNGDFARGAFWLIVTPGLWIGSGGMLGWACHLTSAYTAHRRAARQTRAPVLV